METIQAVAVFDALGQPTRLEIFRLLVKAEPDGLPAGEIARMARVPQNTASVHLAILSRAGLIGFERQGRQVIYRARLEQLRTLMRFLAEDCCGGQPESCAPLVEGLIPCGAPACGGGSCD